MAFIVDVRTAMNNRMRCLMKQTVLLCLAFLLLVASGEVASAAGSSATDAKTYAMEQDTNRYGEDYKDLDLDAPDPARCAEACMNEAKCKAWTYVKPGVQADNARCWLKNKVPPPSADDNCVSGVKRKQK
jgi:hypothetical protein